MRYRQKRNFIDDLTWQAQELGRRITIARSKAILRLTLEEASKDVQIKIEERLKELEKLDLKANYFNLSERDLREPYTPQTPNYAKYLTIRDYISFITDDFLFDEIPISILSKILINTNAAGQGLPTINEIRDLYGDEYLKFIISQDNPLSILENHYSTLKDKSLLEMIRRFPREHTPEENAQFFTNLLLINTRTPLINSETISKIQSGEDIINLPQLLRSSIQDRGFQYYDGKFNINYYCLCLYGLEYKQVRNLVNKYGADLDLARSPESDDIKRVMQLNPVNFQKILALYPTISMMGLSDSEIAGIDENRLKELEKIQEVFFTLKEMKSIISKDYDSPEEQRKMIDYLQSRMTTQPIISYVDFQSKIIKIFENEYNRVAYDPKKSAIRLDDISSKLGVNICEVDYDNLGSLMGCVRVENAYHSNLIKRDRDKYAVVDNTLYDGMPTSFISAENLAFCYMRANDVIGGYTNLHRLQNMAPWDFVSWKSISEKIAPENVPYDKNKPGIQFRFPRNMINVARLGTTEISYYGFDFNGSEFRKIEPDFYYYEVGGRFDPKNPKSIEANPEKYSDIVYPGSNNEEFYSWFETLREARRTGKPIVLFDRQKILEKYKEKIQQLNEAFCREDNIDFKIQLLEQMIVLYENCSNPVMTTHDEEIQSEFFGKNNRRNFYSSILTHIETIIKQDSTLGLKLIEAYRQFCEKELAKLYTNVSSRGGGHAANGPYQFRLFDNYDLEETMVEQLDKINLIEGKYYVGDYVTFTPCIYLRQLMQRNRQPIGEEQHYQIPGAFHGIEHPDKVMLIGDAIAQKEGLSEYDRKLVAIACMLHDWEREDNSSNTSHGVAGAKRILEEYAKGNLDFLGLTPEDVPLIAAAVNYHSYNYTNSAEHFKQNNYIDERYIRSTLLYYSANRMNLFSPEERSTYIARAIKICTILRDADNLDRNRFSSEIPHERPTYSFLLTDGAKSTEVRTYAHFLNEQYARMMLETNYPSALITAPEDISYVDLLQQQRNIQNRIRNIQYRGRVDFYAEYHEKPIPIEQLWDKLYSLSPRIKIANREKLILPEEVGKATQQVGITEKAEAKKNVKTDLQTDKEKKKGDELIQQ